MMARHRIAGSETLPPVLNIRSVTREALLADYYGAICRSVKTATRDRGTRQRRVGVVAGDHAPGRSGPQ